MNVFCRASIPVLVALLMCLTGWVAAEAGSPSAYGKLPLSFEANQGQTDPSVDFVARSTGYQLFLTRDEAVLVLRRSGAASADTLRMALVGASPARPHGVDRLPGAVNYLLGNDPAAWRTSIPIYAKVLARGVYPGVDLVYYGNQRQLEYDFIVAPGADPAAIRLTFHGLAAPATQRALSLDEGGALTLRVPGGDVRLERPLAYQEDAQGSRQPVKVAFALVPAPAGQGSWHVGFEVGAYDRDRPLVIDPVLSYATYLGDAAADAAMAIAVRDGEAYVTGYTESLAFPASGAQPDLGGGRDAFVAKLNATGTALVYATYLGGGGADEGTGIAVDSAGAAYVTGFTESADFPTAPATPLFDDLPGRDAFVTKLNAAGTDFVYSTYLGGALDDTGLGIAVDSAGNAYVTGWTESTDFPTTVSAFQGDLAGRDAFVSKLGPTGLQLLYSTYLGGSGIDQGHAIAVDATGLAHVTGTTTSTDLVTTAANTRAPAGGQDAFVAKMDPGAAGAASRLYLTYFGGSGDDAGHGIGIDSLGSILVVGTTASDNLPAKFAYQSTRGGAQDAFLAKFNPAGTGPNAALMYSSFLGGSGDDSGHAIAVDAEDQAYVTGFTTSPNFPLLHALDSGLGGARDAFVAKFDPADPGEPSLRYSTYLGGSGEDEGRGIALDASGNAYVVGLTRSEDFPGTVGGVDGPEDAFVVKLSEPDLAVPVFTVPATGGAGQAIAVTVTTRNTGSATAPASTTRIFLSADNRLDASDTPLGSRDVGELAPGAEDTAELSLTLPTPLPPAGYFLFARADGDDQIGEAFESNNRTRRSIAIGTDLTVTVLTASSSGLTLTVTDTTRNVGGASVVASRTKFFLAGPGTSGTEVALDLRDVPALAPGTESTATTELQIPAGTVAGSYNVVARADATGVIEETNETNNERSTPFSVGVDLIVSALTVPGTSGAGASITVTPTIQNKGQVASTASTTEFFLTTASTLDASAVSIGTQAAPALGPGATSAVATQVTIPANTAAGSYFLFAKANSVTPIAETNGNNNTRARTTVVGPDLTISFLSPSSATSGPGKNITFKDTTKNIGGGTAPASVTKIYLSTDATFDATDTELGQRTVPSLAPGASHFNAAGVVVTLPATITAGSYFIIVRANAGASPIGEVTTSNNTTTASLTVNGADLVVSVLTVTLSGTTTLTITDTTRNQGTASAAASVTRFHFSTNDTFDEATDPVLGDRAVGALAVGGSSEATNTFSLPAGTPPGTYTVFARADATGVVSESDESNNRRARTIDTRGADLIVPNLLFSFGTNSTIEVTETTRNEGPAVAGASQTRIYLSADATFGAGDTPLGIRSVVSLGAGSQSTGTTSVAIPGTVAAGDYFLIVRADDAGVVGEVNEDNNTASVPITIKPDLRVTVLSHPSTTTAGASITATGTIRNDGPIPSGASILKLFLSADATLETATDTLLATTAMAAVGSARTEDFSVQFTLPAGTAGNLFVIAKIDADEQINESNELNNTRNRALAVGPDLIISAFSGVPAAAGAGSSFTVSDTTRNLSAAAVDASTTRFVLSADAVFDATDVAIGTRAVPALGARKTNSANTLVTIPAGTASGSYFVIAVADATQEHVEASETNNTASAPIVIGSDLVVSAVGAPSSAGSGVTITVTDTTTNQGGASAGASATNFYLSTNATFEAGDILLGSRAVGALAPGTGSSGSTDVVIPAGTPGGTYFIIARSDADGNVNEVIETNNTLASGPVVLGTDLVISALSVPLTSGPGAVINISETVMNVGGTLAGESVVKLFLSTDAVVDGGDSLLGSRLVPALDPGGSSAGVTQVTIPVDASSGVFFVIAQTDANGQVSEVNETNNTASSQLRTGPDLLVTLLTIPAEGAGGGVINIRDAVKNQGAASGTSVARYFFSTDDILDAGDTLLASRNVPALTFGASSFGNLDVTLPAGLSAGTYFIIAQADATGILVEAAEDNNLRSKAIAIGPDYINAAVSGPAEGGAGLPVTIGASTRNQGAAGAATITQFFLSSDEVLSGNDAFLGSRQVPALNAGAQSTGSITVTLPAGLAPGQYFVIAKANGDGAVTETNTTNNTKARSIIVGPDLVVSALTVPTPVGAGIPFTVSDTTKNLGAGATTASTTSFFLSADALLDPSDIFLGSRAVPGLAPGALHAASTSLTIPIGTPGGSYLVIARANEPNSVAELDATNNERSKQTKVGPDLVLSTLAAQTSAAAGSTFNVTDTTTNQGAGDAGPFTVRIYLSVDDVLELGIDPEIGSRVIGGLAPGAASTGPISVTIPAGIEGTFRLIGVADADNVVSETIETNNNKQRSINVVP